MAEKPAASTDATSLNATMSHINGLRIIAILEKGIERLQLLSLLNYESYPNSNDQYVEIQGMDESPSGVGNILEEQKKLEQRHEELLIALSHQKPNMMDPQLDPVAYQNVDNVVERQQKEELHYISAQLKEFSKQLTRQLKENPNDSDNWKKVLNERAELTNMISACVRELTTSVQNALSMIYNQNQSTTIMAATGSQIMHFDNVSQRSGESFHSFRSNSHLAGGQKGGVTEASYEEFAKKVIDEQNEKIWADDVVKREKETNMNVKTLQNEVTQEKLLKEREIEERQLKLSELKTKVRRLKQEAKEQSEKRKADSEANAEARARAEKDRQRLLRDQIEKLEKQLEIENEVFQATEKHMNKKSTQLQAKTNEWGARQVEENKDIDRRLTNERRRREDQMEALKAAEERYTIETERKQDREQYQRRQDHDRKRWDEWQKSEYQAATKLEAAFKGFLCRKMINDLKKKGKKGKKGK